MGKKEALFEDKLDFETDDVKEESDSILDMTEEEIDSANKKKQSGDMLFPEEEEEVKRISKTKRKRERGESTRTVPPVSQDLLDEIGDLLGSFDAETANKKAIRGLRKGLQQLSLARYPKKKRAKKKKSKK
jgi:hypothetical protein